jgi:hypothetical protein
MVAHCLAKSAAINFVNHCWMDVPPNCIVGLLFRDHFYHLFPGFGITFFFFYFLFFFFFLTFKKKKKKKKFFSDRDGV